MNEIKIGDKFYTIGYGDVKVIDIYVSPTSNEILYKIEDMEEEGMTFYCDPEELINQ